jgi:type IV pilus assembly protein PilC
MKFKYKVKVKNGELVQGIRESSDKFALAREFREIGDFPISIKEVKEKSLDSFSNLNFNLKIFNRVSLSEKISFTKNLSGMLQAGLSLSRALQVLGKQSTKGYLHDIVNSLIEDIDKGNTLSFGMKKYPKVFTSLFIAMIRAGEESGTLPNTLNEIGSNLKKSYDLNKKIKSALMYPSIIVGAIFLIGVLMMIYVVPTLTATFKDLGVSLPPSTQAIILISDFMSGHTILFLFLVLVVAGGFVMFARLKTTKKYFDHIILHLPVIGTIIKEMNAARTSRTLSSLLVSGVDVSRALAITEEVLQNIYYKKVVRDSITSIEKGVPLSTSFKENAKLYPIMVGEMIEVGEETGKLSSMLLDVALFYEGEVDNKTRDLSTIIEPVLMVFVGAAVGFFAISMISPIYSVMDTIK